MLRMVSFSFYSADASGIWNILKKKLFVFIGDTGRMFVCGARLSWKPYRRAILCTEKCFGLLLMLMRFLLMFES